MVSNSKLSFGQYKLNYLNVDIRGKNNNILVLSDKINAPFCKKIMYIDTEIVLIFSCLTEFLSKK